MPDKGNVDSWEGAEQVNKSNDLSANSGSLAGFQVLLSTNLTKNLIESSSYRSCSTRLVTESLSEIQKKGVKARVA